MNQALAEALKHYGLTEAPGSKNNPELIKLIQSELCWVEDDSKIAWCGIFATHVIKRAYGEDHIPDGPYAARSWLRVGKEVDSDEAQPGDIVVFWRKSPASWQGHVGFFINYTEDGRIRVLGGNQSNAVNIRIYDDARLLGIRRLIHS